MRTNWTQSARDRGVEAFAKSLSKSIDRLDVCDTVAFADLLPHPPVRSRILEAARGIADRIGTDCRVDQVLEATAAYYGLRDWNALSAATKDISLPSARPGQTHILKLCTGLVREVTPLHQQLSKLYGGKSGDLIITIEDPPEFLRPAESAVYRRKSDGKLMHFVRYDDQARQAILCEPTDVPRWLVQVPISVVGGKSQEPVIPHTAVSLAEIDDWLISDEGWTFGTAKNRVPALRDPHLPFIMAGLPPTISWDGRDTENDGHLVLSRRLDGRVLTNLPVGELPRKLLLAANNAAEAAALALILVNGGRFRYLEDRKNWVDQLQSAGTAFAHAFMPRPGDICRVPLKEGYKWLKESEGGIWWCRACDFPLGTWFA